MTRSYVLFIAVVALSVLCAVPVHAWGPETQKTLVTVGVRLLSKDGTIPLVNLESEVRKGSALSAKVLSDVYPMLERNPIGAIESEMYLLQSVRGKRVDPYFAYRLGMLGNVVARATSPLATSTATYRNMYYADVDNQISRAVVEKSSRVFVEPRTYFSSLMMQSQTQDLVILRDYQEGRGFNGVAKTSLSESVNRSIRAIVDVWYTVVTGRATSATISGSQIRDYYLKALDYYIRSNKTSEVEASYANLMGLGVDTPDLRKSIGDMFFGAGSYERAIAEYREVLKREPARKDIREKMAKYFVSVGDQELKADKLEPARDAYEAALDVHKLHPTAPHKLLQANRLIANRDERHEKTREIIKDADNLEAMSEREASRHNYAQAIALLKQAKGDYDSVSTEFPEEFQVANAASRNISFRLMELKTGLIQNAQSLSGTGFTGDARLIAGKRADELATQALKEMTVNKYKEELEALKAEKRDVLE